MKTLKIYSLVAIPVTAALLLAASSINEGKRSQRRIIPKECVFRTVMGEESSDSSFVYKTPYAVFTSVDRGLDWIAQAQNGNGGWGAGSHARQDVTDPHAVQTDPATTAMVAMALLRSGNTLTKGEYSSQLKKALNYLLSATENSPASSYNITDQTGTQIQTKLGANIDVVLT